MQDVKIASGALQGMSVAKACNPQPKPGDMFSTVLKMLIYAALASFEAKAVQRLESGPNIRL